MNTVFEFMLSNSIFVFVFAVIILVVGRFVRKHPAVLHLLWVLLLVKLVTPPLASMSVEHERWFPVKQDSSLTSQSSGQPLWVQRIEVSKSQQESYDPFGNRRPRSTVEESMSSAAGNEQSDMTSFELPPPIAEGSEPASLPNVSKLSVPSLLFWTWLGIVVFVLARQYFRWAQFLKSLDRKNYADEKLISAVECLAVSMGLRSPPSTFVTDQLISPLVIPDWNSNRVVIPKLLVEELESTELQSLVAHELAHLKRRDPWVRMLEIFVTAIYWWNPLLWLIRTQIRRHEEFACDAMVVSGKYFDPETYASAFLKTIDFVSTGSCQDIPATCTIGTAKFYERRLRGIMANSNRPNIFAWQKCLVCFIGLVLLPLGIQESVGIDEPTSAKTGLLGIASLNTTLVERQNQDGGQTSDAAKVVEVFPKSNSKNVPLETVIRVRFDQPVHAGAMALDWSPQTKTGFRSNGPIEYDADKNELSIPVILKAGTHHLHVNQTEMFAGFRNKSGKPAKAFAWVFETVEPQAAGDGAASVVNVSPKPGSEISLVSSVFVKFDRPMNPNHFDLSSGTEDFFREIKFAAPVKYDSDNFEFEFPLIFPANWNGVVSFANFVDSNGRPATVSPEYNYRTLRSVVSESEKARIKQAGKSQVLSDVLTQIKRSTQGAKSIEVNVTQQMQTARHTWDQSLSVSTMSFVRDGAKYFGDVTQVMGGSNEFKLGCDGKQIWMMAGKEVWFCPVEEVAEQSVSIAQPFNGFKMTIAGLIEKEKLEYLGKQNLDGRAQHVIRAWANVEQYLHAGLVNGPMEYFFDAETLRVTKVRSSQVELSFAYSSVDQPIDESVFAIPNGGGIKISPFDPLGEGFEKRYAKIHDGSGGRPSLRFGKIGPGGRSSSGLN